MWARVGNPKKPNRTAHESLDLGKVLCFGVHVAGEIIPVSYELGSNAADVNRNCRHVTGILVYI